MNKLTSMKKFAFIGICVLGVAWGCKDDEEDVVVPPVEVFPTLKVTSTLAGDSIGYDTTATGAVDGTLDQETNILKLNITYSDSSAMDSTGTDSTMAFMPTAWHIHKTASGADTTAAVVINLGTTFTSPFAFTDTLTDAQVTDLKAGSYYMDIHTAKYPNGAIRGQLTARE